MQKNISFIFDTETNGFANCSVLSISYIISQNNNILHQDTRYYFSQEPYNHHAFQVHGLDEESIDDKRAKNKYPLYFEDDKNWLIDIFNKYNVDNIVAHNLSFDTKFLPQEIKNKIKNKEYSTFCTMQQNRHITKNNKAPKLIEACKLYNIKFDEYNAHSSDYDTLKCFEVFVKTIV
ncbi:MAG: 3'-5' exonuclease [Sulfurovum sp.]